MCVFVCVKGRGSSRHRGCTRAAGGCDDRVTIWGKRGVGSGWSGWSGWGFEQKKSQCLQMGWRVGSLLISCLSSPQKISGKQRPRCLSCSQCEDEDGLSGDMEMCSKLCNTACLHDAYIVLKKKKRMSLKDDTAAKGKSQDVFKKTLQAVKGQKEH